MTARIRAILCRPEKLRCVVLKHVPVADLMCLLRVDSSAWWGEASKFKWIPTVLH